ncbi:hypothetical protein D0Z00_002235 [Geotrichum galactomycetum]|uniref:Uncharacterized protein n=1 Tax=Geotrichum galactomycetum TaxID=27317 RepID=A0ACB6V4M5_9ASCO|nr:hypothetical protein D0Z00_002235 [Geotrichum candidum]
MSLTKKIDPHTIHVSPWTVDLDAITTGNLASFMLESPGVTGNLDKKLFIDANAPTTNYLTGADIIEQTQRLSHLLKTKYGVRENDVVCLWLFNSIYLPLLHYAVLGLGAIVSPANVGYLPNELNHQLTVSQTKIIISEASLVAKAKEATDLSETNVAHIISYDEIMEGLATTTTQQPPLYISLEQAKIKHAYYCFSSGTSGAAKGVITTHYNIASNIIQTKIVTASIYYSDSLFGAVLPMSHIFGLQTFIYSCPYLGNSTIIFRQFNLELVLQKTSELKINFFHIVPPIAVLFAKSPLVDQYPDVKKYIKQFICGAAPLSKTLANAVSSRIGCRIQQAYGLTETSPMTHFFSYDVDAYDLSGVGWLVPGVEARLVDEHGEHVHTFDTPGELVMRGPNIMKGYLRNPQATREAFTDDTFEWFKTGDVAVIKPDGQYQIVDRFKELIKSKGHQVAPAELEAILLTHPDIADAAVTGFNVPDEGTELPRAFIVLKSGAGTGNAANDALAVKQWFDTRVARHKQLWGGIVMLPEVPKSPSGKILRRMLRDRKNDFAHGYTNLKPKL